MGCAYSNINSQLPVSSPKIVPISSLLPPEKAGSFKVRILETIKKMDPILFEKVLQQYKPKLNEFTQPLDSKKNLMHHIAESNFADGMTLTIDYILQKNPNKLSGILNSLDADSNTPAMTCCIYNAPETLEIIIKHELFDSNTKNCENKTALDLAFENSLPCVNLLTVTTTTNTNTNTKTASKFFLASSVELLSPRPRASSISALSGGDRRNSRKPSRFFSISESRELTSPLTTVMSLTKETSLKLAPSTKLYSILNGLKDTDQNVFIDDEFPHNMFSILGESSLTLFGPGSKQIKWQRPTEFLNTELKKIKVFEAIDLNIVTMSELAGSDLYSALGIMTEFPQRLLNTFTIKEVNKHGAYSVKFLISGIPIEIVLDDHFPCYDDKNLLFSKPVTNELWFLLIEKAFAKLYGSYEEVKNVDISDALELMTGMPSYQHDIKGTEEEDLWDIMQTYDRKNYIYCAGKYKMGEGKGNRIFSIVNLYENDQYKIIKLRDHFQDFLWDGMFSEKSKHWTKELREETGYIKGERGCVYMELQEFVKHFDFLSVCHYHEGWIRNRVDVVAGPNTAALFEINLDQEMDLFISVHQKLPRYVTESPDYDISPVEILLIEKTEEGGLKKLTAGEKEAFIGKQTTYANRDIKIRLSEGKYLVRVKVRWVDKKPHEFTLSTFSSHDLVLRQLKIDEYPNLLERVYLDCGARVKDKYQLKNECEFISAWCGSHLWIYAVNKGNKLWTLEINFETLINLRIPKKYLSGSNTVRMVIPPNGDRVVYLKRIDTDIVNVDWKLKHDWN